MYNFERNTKNTMEKNDSLSLANNFLSTNLTPLSKKTSQWGIGGMSFFQDWHWSNENSSKKDSKNTPIEDKVKSEDEQSALYFSKPPKLNTCYFSKKLGIFDLQEEKISNFYAIIKKRKTYYEKIYETDAGHAPHLSYKKGFFVTSAITQYALGLMGKSSIEGDYISTEEVKLLRKKTLLLHPDKTKNLKNEDFKNAQHGYELLLEEEYNPYEKNAERVERQATILSQEVYPDLEKKLEKLFKKENHAELLANPTLDLEWLDRRLNRINPK